jgi:Ceramidase
MDWTAPVDLYCERIGPGFWAEPLNAVSNAAFLVAAGWGLARTRRGGQHDFPAFLLALLVAVIGVGSFLFHTLAVRWSNLADVLPITVFIYGYFFLAMRRFLGLGRLAGALATLLFLAASFAVAPALVPLLGGSAGYAPALLAVLGVGAAARRRGSAGADLLLAAGIAFAASLTLRTLDQPLCAVLPAGTHFLWHVLNALTLALLLAAAMAARPRATA